jgi:hypothetical protein
VAGGRWEALQSSGGANALPLLIVPPSLPPSRRIEDIDEKATVLADSAQKFKNAGTALKRKMRCRYYKIMIFFGFLVAAILAAIIAYFVQKKKTEDEQKAAGQ